MKTEFLLGEETLAAEWEREGPSFRLKLQDRVLVGEILRWDPPFFSVRHCGHVLQGVFYRGAGFVDVHLPKGNFRLKLADTRRAAKAGAQAGDLSSPMPGKVIQVLVREGEAVKKGDLLMVLEAMKMEHKVLAPRDGVLGKIHFQAGERVGQDVALMEIAD
ncbi:MAG TPA: biotin/lipoyl-containing protein [bacterium]|nr:biotin/lipoyl-containing protein [bacterium]